MNFREYFSHIETTIKDCPIIADISIKFDEYNFMIPTTGRVHR